MKAKVHITHKRICTNLYIEKREHLRHKCKVFLYMFPHFRGICYMLLRIDEYDIRSYSVFEMMTEVVQNIQDLFK